MTNNSCIFCKVIQGQIPTTFIKETKDLIVIKDIYPQAETHLLIIPKEHVQDIISLNNDALQSSIVAMVRELASTLANPKAFRLVINTGPGYQHVPHLHVHFLSDGVTNPV